MCDIIVAVFFHSLNYTDYLLIELVYVYKKEC